MKKLQIIAGMLSVLLLVGCGGTGVSAKTAGEDPPQTTSADVSRAAAAQNGNENPSEVVTQDEAERPGPVDAEGDPLSGIRFLLESSADQVNWQEVSAAETGADGAVCWENLTADGSTYYRVTEVQTAEGMTLLTEPLFVGTPDAGSHDITITACNNAGFALPFTGGTGFTIYILFAALMLCMGVYFCKKSTTKKEN